MSNMLVEDALKCQKYIKASGEGTDEDPYIIDRLLYGLNGSEELVPLHLDASGYIQAVVTARTTTPAALSISSSGDNEVIPTPGAGKHLEIYRIVATVDRNKEVDVLLKSGSTGLTGAMKADYYALDYGNEPLICGTDEAFVINLSDAVEVTGFVQYLEVTE